MPVSKVEKEFVDHVVELMGSLGQVRAKGMFGGHGIFLDGLMFALIAGRVLYLKTDKHTEQDFLSLDLEPFRYQKNGKEIKMNYFQSPEEVLEDSEQMNIWATKAFEVADRAAAKKRRKK